MVVVAPSGGSGALSRVELGERRRPLAGMTTSQPEAQRPCKIEITEIPTPTTTVRWTSRTWSTYFATTPTC